MDNVLLITWRSLQILHAIISGDDPLQGERSNRIVKDGSVQQLTPELEELRMENTQLRGKVRGHFLCRGFCMEVLEFSLSVWPGGSPLFNRAWGL